VPQVPAAAAGYALLVALMWRKQAAAVLAVEGRDGARFYVDRTSAFKPTRLLRTPGFRRFEASGEVAEPAARAAEMRAGGALGAGAQPRATEPRLRRASSSDHERAFATRSGVTQARRAVATA
jgi:hypothetical protein